MRKLFFLSLLLLNINLVVAQKKKAVFLDTLGKETNFIGMMSIYNTGRYKQVIDESNEKIRYLTWKKATPQQIDSAVEKTKTKFLLPDKLGTAYQYFDYADINGKTISLGEQKNKILVINFWFVGCGPCEIEMPELNALVEKYKKNDNVIFLSFSRSPTTKTIKFLEKKPFRYHTMVMTEELRNQFKISIYPTNYVIDKNGVHHFASKGIGAGSIHIMDSYIQSALRD